MSPNAWDPRKRLWVGLVGAGLSQLNFDGRAPRPSRHEYWIQSFKGMFAYLSCLFCLDVASKYHFVSKQDLAQATLSERIVWKVQGSDVVRRLGGSWKRDVTSITFANEIHVDILDPTNKVCLTRSLPAIVFREINRWRKDKRNFPKRSMKRHTVCRAFGSSPIFESKNFLGNCSRICQV